MAGDAGVPTTTWALELRKRSSTVIDESNAPASARAPDRADLDSPGVTPGMLRRTLQGLRAPLWRPVWTKVASVSAGMVGLAAIGMFSTLRQLDVGQDPSQLREANTWLAGGLPLSETAAPFELQAKAATGAASQEAAQPPSRKPSTSIPRTAPAQAEASNPLAPGLTADGKVILNTANLEELQRLPGVGRKRAEKILELRDRLGRFKRPTDLLRVRGIGVKSLRKMLPHLVLDPPAAPSPADKDKKEEQQASAATPERTAQ